MAPGGLPFPVPMRPPREDEEQEQEQEQEEQAGDGTGTAGQEGGNGAVDPDTLEDAQVKECSRSSRSARLISPFPSSARASL